MYKNEVYVLNDRCPRALPNSGDHRGRSTVLDKRRWSGVRNEFCTYIICMNFVCICCCIWSYLFLNNIDLWYIVHTVIIIGSNIMFSYYWRCWLIGGSPLSLLNTICIVNYLVISVLWNTIYFWAQV